MAHVTIPFAHTPSNTALVLVDPYVEFLDPSGKLWPMVEATVVRHRVVATLERLLSGVRAAGVRTFYALHHQYEAGDIEGWRTTTNTQHLLKEHRLFQKGSQGAEVVRSLAPAPGDVLARQHWNSDGFAGTDLDLLLRRHGIEAVAVAGMVANTCVEATGRAAIELGYHVTFLSDAVGAFEEAELAAAVELNYPRVAQAVMTVDEFVAAIGGGARTNVRRSA